MGSELLHADLTFAIRGVLYDVANHIGPGLPERDVQKAVSIGLASRRIPHTLEEQFHVFYRDVEVGRYYCDLVVDGKVIVELKVVSQITNLHRAQTLAYLRVTGLDVALLANLGTARVAIQRYANFFAQHQAAFAWQPEVLDHPCLLYPELVNELYRCMHCVHFELGPGFMHQVYRRAVQVELDDQNVSFEYVREMPVYYLGEHVSQHQCRFLLVEDKVIVAAFAVKDMNASFDARMEIYLKHFGLKLGLLANFHDERLDIRPVRVA